MIETIIILTAASAVTRAVWLMVESGHYPFRKPRVVTGASTEALEAWLDAYNAVLDPYSATIEDVDARASEALAAADATLPWDTGKTRSQKRGRCASCGVRNGAKKHMSWCVEQTRERMIGISETGKPKPPPKPADALASVTPFSSPKMQDGRDGWTQRTRDGYVILHWAGLTMKLSDQEFRRQGNPSAKKAIQASKHSAADWDAQKQAFIDGTEIERMSYESDDYVPSAV